MAKKKKEDTLQYLQMPLPSGGRYSKMTKVAFGGLNKRYTLDSGDLSMESNISTNEYPYLVPSSKKTEITSDYPNAISMFAFDNFILVVYRENTAIKIDYITENGDTHTGVIKTLTQGENETPADFNKRVSAEDDIQRSIVQFNVYIDSGDIVNGTYTKKLLIFPDKVSMDFEITADFTPSPMDADLLIKTYTAKEETDLPPDTASHNYYYKNSKSNAIYKWVDDESDSAKSGWEKLIVTPAMPNIKYATVHLSRLFGVSDDTVYASGFNDYTNWNLDTIDEYNESNAWMSKTQSNTKADGNFTGIINYQGHIVCFKKDFMHEIYNTKNPFRLTDIYAEGTIDNRTIQDVDGKLIFVSEDNVKVYTGSNPRIISYNLNMTQNTYAVSGTDNRNYYLYREDDKKKKYLYVYDTFTDLWSEQSIESRVLSFAHNKNGMYMLCKNGCVYKMDTDDYSHIWSFETDLITNKTVDIKHIKKLQMLVELENKENTNIDVYILYDDEVFDNLDPEEKAKRLVYSNETRKRYGKFPIRVKPRKTANYGFKLHIEGEGYVKLYELEIFVEAGGDLYV
jgi:hypothetical protein